MRDVKFPKALAPEAVALPPGPERTHYRAPLWRRAFYALATLLVLPFAASLPIMLFQRLAIGRWQDALPLFVFAAFAFTIFYLLIVALNDAVTSRVDLEAEHLLLRAPNQSRIFPRLSGRGGKIAYRDIGAIEIRSEVFGGSFLPVLLHGVHMTTTGGESVPLGYTQDRGSDPAFPFPLIGRQIAQRAGVRLAFDPHIWRTVHSRSRARALGVMPGTPHALSASDMRDINVRHRRNLLVLVNLAFMIFAIGVAFDLTGR